MKKLNCKNASIVFILLMILFTLFNSFLVYYNPERQGLKISALSEEIPEINLSTLPQINLPELNRTWYDPKIEMIIITPNDTNFVNAVTPLANWKNKKGVKTIIFSNFSKYDGKDNAEKIRNLIKHYFIKEN
ncbi:MAG: C25 family cysteine peptidase, partial [Promethearchaeota archaeon]